VPLSEINVSTESFKVYYTDNEQALKCQRNPVSECETILNDLLRFGDFSFCYRVLKNTIGRIKNSQESSSCDNTRDSNFFIVCCRSAGRKQHLHFTSPDGPV